jgi:hypothetical protein
MFSGAPTLFERTFLTTVTTVAEVAQSVTINTPQRAFVIAKSMRPVATLEGHWFALPIQLKEANLSNFVLKTAACVVTWLATSTLAVSADNLRPPAQDKSAKATQHTRKLKLVVYINREYGFRFSLPESWRNYSVKTSEWEGGDGRTYESHEDVPPPQKGPIISIEHPQSSQAYPRQNIPIMVFTKAQWQLVEKGELIVSAAPVGPNELGRNAKYVFALPARYNYAFIEGWEEVDKIIQAHPLQAF